MSGTPIVDLLSWRAAHAQDGATEQDALQGGGPDDAGAARSQPAPGQVGQGEATIIRLPEPVVPAPAVSGAPRSVFGPVVAFGLVPRAPMPRPVAVGDDEAVTAAPRGRARSRHVADVRGSSRGPAR